MQQNFLSDSDTDAITNETQKHFLRQSTSLAIIVHLMKMTKNDKK